MVADIIIIGGGIIGSSTAYHLKRENPKKNIVLVEKNSKIASGNTARSAALYRNLFSSETSQILSTNSIQFYQTIAKQISMKNSGYLWMFSEENWKKSKKGLDKLMAFSDSFEILSAAELPVNLKFNLESSSSFPSIKHALLGKLCGSLSAVSLARYYSTKFTKLGGRILLDTEIQKLNLSEKDRNYPPWANIILESLVDQKGNTYKAKQFVFATGAWTDKLLTPIGIASQIYPKRRQMFTLKLDDVTQIANDPSINCPILILPAGGVYVKPILRNKLLVVGCASNLGEPFGLTEYPPKANEKFFENVIEPVLDHYFTELTKYRLYSQWAGYYAYYCPDKNPVIERIANIVWVSGTSGSGIMKADSIGRITAGKIIDKDEVELFSGQKFNIQDLSLRNRFVANEELII